MSVQVVDLNFQTGFVADLGYNAARGTANGDDDDEARRSESRSKRTACSAVRIDQDNISVCILSTSWDLPVRIDQEVEMTDRLQEQGYIYYKRLRTDQAIM